MRRRAGWPEPMIVPRRRLGRLGAAGLAACLLAACAGPPETCGPSVAAGSDVAGYRLGPGDQVQVTVFRQPDLSGPFGLDGEGRLRCRWRARSRPTG